jgi:hypothetical protein
MLRLLPRDYWRLAPLVDGVPSLEGIQDDVDTTPFRETGETLVEMASYLVDLDKYARRLEDESLNLFDHIRDATIDAYQYQPHCVQLEREREQCATLPCSPARAKPRPRDRCPAAV